VLREDGAAERVDLDELHGSHPGSLKAEAESADPAE
jgi:hypothetical protein